MAGLAYLCAFFTVVSRRFMVLVPFSPCFLCFWLSWWGAVQ